MLVGGAGSGGKRQAMEDETVPGRVCTAPQPPVRECRRSILDHCFVYRITTTGWTLFSRQIEPTICFGAQWSLSLVTFMCPHAHLYLVICELELPPRASGPAIMGGLEEVGSGVA